MFHRMAVVGGLIGGALGAGLWAVVALVANYEIGWIAWAVGGMVGFGVAWGNRAANPSPQAAGILAVAITVLAIPAGKYAGIQLSFPPDDELLTMLMESAQSEEYVKSFLADEVVEERTAMGETVDWPPGVDPSMATTAAEYPEPIWAEAEARWAGMNERERANFRADVEETTRANLTAQLPEIRSAISQGAFAGSFAAMDLVFFGLAMVTAWGVASGTTKSAEEVAGELMEAVKLAMVRVILADGRADAEEIRVVREIYARLTGLELSEDEVRRELQAAGSESADVMEMLEGLAPHLNDEGKALVVRAAVEAAGADGKFRDSEKMLIADVANSLGMSREELHELLGSIFQESAA
ncbi:MAG: hypothetical protein GWM92_03100 [Gemmatimonadetes bacterium]|nr:TerB family tellurite resistance protein [Gemmatimonadota bacterium]NIR77484.1 TerB family tellurite resistance protein [Gemmatimonadota bacterium]NIT86008.1 TerB family tellurite resistance protein [Gemmatimonadota bacterium]NIU29828.1 TerB family tellurite resistance protein [Gemmatimonadota bacterium]NIU34850.1 hypothetical protein [Gemmatimonadota bacterium]